MLFGGLLKRIMQKDIISVKSKKVKKKKRSNCKRLTFGRIQIADVLNLGATFATKEIK